MLVFEVTEGVLLMRALQALLVLMKLCFQQQF